MASWETMNVQRIKTQRKLAKHFFAHVKMQVLEQLLCVCVFSLGRLRILKFFARRSTVPARKPVMDLLVGGS